MNATSTLDARTPRRISWDVLPASLRKAAEDALGATVVGDAPQTGGFSPGLASRLLLSDGRRVFAKAINIARNPRSPGLYRREIDVMRTLPASAPAPQLQWSYDDGDWVMLVLDDVDGVMPDLPWRPPQLVRVMNTLETLAERLSPSPVAATPIDKDLEENFTSWSTIAADPALAAQLSGWEQTNLAQLVEWETEWSAAARGDTLLHADLRADNLLLTSDAVVVVDWPYAVVGAPWVDALLFLPSVAANSDVAVIDVEETWSAFRPARAVDPDAVNAVLTALAGDFRLQSLLPAPQNLPTLRAHQARQATAASSWLRARRGGARVG